MYTHGHKLSATSTSFCFLFRWWIGPWQRCSRTCRSSGPGGSGVHHRTVLCVRSHGLDEQIALEDHECTDEKPETTEPCKHKELCPQSVAHWEADEWSMVRMENLK